jgi:hypothetical protein
MDRIILIGADSAKSTFIDWFLIDRVFSQVCRERGADAANEETPETAGQTSESQKAQDVCSLKSIIGTQQALGQWGRTSCGLG